MTTKGPSSQRRLGYATVVSSIALMVALGGTGYAIVVTGMDVKNGSLSGRDIRNDSLKQKDLGVDALTTKALGVDGISRLNDVILSADSAGFRTIARVETTTKRTLDMLALGSVQVESTGGDDALIKYRVLLDGQLHHEYYISDEVPSGTTDISTISILCNFVPAGDHVVELQATLESGTLATFSSRSFDVVSMQDFH